MKLHISLRSTCKYTTFVFLATFSLIDPGGNDRTGDELTPGAKYDFKFKDYAPWVFRHLREKFGIDPADYLVCCCQV